MELKIVRWQKSEEVCPWNHSDYRITGDETITVREGSRQIRAFRSRETSGWGEWSLHFVGERGMRGDTLKKQQMEASYSEPVILLVDAFLKKSLDERLEVCAKGWQAVSGS